MVDNRSLQPRILSSARKGRCVKWFFALSCTGLVIFFLGKGSPLVHRPTKIALKEGRVKDLKGAEGFVGKLTISESRTRSEHAATPDLLSTLQAIRERVYKQNVTSDVEDLESGLDEKRLGRALPMDTTFTRLETVFKRAILQQSVLTIGVTGGSISAATCVGRQNLYAEKLRSNLQDALGTVVELRNGAVGATGSKFHTYCIDNYLNLTEVDVLLWECSVNDNKQDCSAQEEFTRKVLLVPHGLELVYVNFVVGLIQHRCITKEAICSKPLSDYYDVPAVNMNDSICDLIRRGKAEYLATSLDRVRPHPNVKYHSIVGNLLTRMFNQVLMTAVASLEESLMNSEEGTGADLEPPAVNTALPPPLYENTKISVTQCWSLARAETGNKSPLVTIENKGWNITNPLRVTLEKARVDSKQYWGPTEPNSTITFEVFIKPYKHEKAHVLLATWDCDDCGDVIAWLDGDESSASTVETSYGLGFCNVMALSNNVKPGRHTISLRNVSRRVRVVAIFSGYDSM